MKASTARTAGLSSTKSRRKPANSIGRFLGLALMRVEGGRRAQGSFAGPIARRRSRRIWIRMSWTIYSRAAGKKDLPLFLGSAIDQLYTHSLPPVGNSSHVNQGRTPKHQGLRRNVVLVGGLWLPRKDEAVRRLESRGQQVGSVFG